MESNKKEFIVFTNYERVFIELIEQYNSVYKTDFELVQYVKDETHFAIVGYQNATEQHIFHLGQWLGVEEFKKQNNYYPPRQSSFK